MNRAANVRSAIRSELAQQNPCNLDTLVDRLSQYSWSQIFTAIDQLSRNGDLVLRHPTRFGYEVSLGPIASTARGAT